MYRRGFTLIELLVVIAVIAILSAVIVQSLNTARAKGRNAARLVEIKQLVNAFNLGMNADPTTLPDGGGWVCVSTSCYGGWSVYTSNAAVDAFLSPFLPQKVADPADGNARGYGGFLYYKTWAGDGTSNWPPGPILNWLQETAGGSCGPAGKIYSQTGSYVQCVLYLN